MKCWTRYMLPLVMAFCLFLGSSFYSQAAEGRETNTAAIDYSACITECPGLAGALVNSCGDTYYYLGSCYEGTIYLFASPSPIQVYGVPSGGSGIISVYAYDLRIIKVDVDLSSYEFSYVGSGNCGVGTRFDLPTAFANHDIFDRSTGELFFHQPSPFQRAVQNQDWMAVMTEIVIILPLLILFLTSLIGLRKGLRFVSSFLHQA